MVRRVLPLLLAFGLAACASAPQPKAEQIADACALLKDNKDWYRALRASAKDWGAPMGLQLAIIKQESSFDAKARPEREGGFLIFPGKRPSSARGYAQALDPTWEVYKNATGNSNADRRNFKDAADFIGWYVNNSGREAGIRQYDYRAHYLAYHEGPRGYVKGTWKKKKWLVSTANTVASQATRYESQISSCKGLKSKFLGIF